MRIIGKFKILDSFKINGRGLVARGEITEGVVKQEAFLSIRVDTQIIPLRTRSIEFIDNVSKKESCVGLLFDYDSIDQMKELENINLTEQIVEVYIKD